MSGAEVIGAISGVASLIGESIKIYERARRDLKLSETFEAIESPMVIIRDTLLTCKNKFDAKQDFMPKDLCEALNKTIDACDDKAQELRNILRKTMPGEEDGWMKRYRTAVLGKLGKGKKVEDLVKAIQTDLQQIVNNDLVRSATSAQIIELKEKIEHLDSLPSSLPEENVPESFNSGGGTQNNYVNYGHGTQNNINGQQNHGGTQYYNYGKDQAYM